MFGKIRSRFKAHYNFAKARHLLRYESGDRAENIAQAIALCEESLQFFNPKSHPEMWGWITYFLAEAYTNSLTGDAAQNTEKATHLLNQIIETSYTDQHNYGLTPAFLLLGKICFFQAKESSGERRAGKLKEAISYNLNALQYCSPTRDRKEMSLMHYLIAICFSLLPDKSFDHHLQIVYHAKKALEVFTKEKDPQAWARMQIILIQSSIYNYSRGKSESMRMAAQNLKEAASILEHEFEPEEMADLRRRIIEAQVLGLEDARVNKEATAISEIQDDIDRFTASADPYEQSFLHRIFSLALVRKHSVPYPKHGSEDFEMSLEHARKSLEGLNQCEDPLIFMRNSQLVNSLSIMQEFTAALERAGSELEKENEAVAGPVFADTIDYRIDRAIDYIRENNPQAIASLNEKVQKGLEQYKQALESCSREEDPDLWAVLNLGVVGHYVGAGFFEQQEERRIAAIEQAIHHFDQVLDSIQRAATPQEIRMLTRLYGTLLFFNTKRWEKAAKLYDIALNAHEIIYKTSIGLKEKQSELNEITDLLWSLAINQAYVLARLGQTEQAILLLEKWRARQLAERLQINAQALTEIRKQDSDAYQMCLQRIAKLQAEQLKSNATAFTSLLEELDKEQARLEAIISRIRQYHPNFLSEFQDEIIQKAATPARPLCYLMVTEQGSLTIIARGSLSPLVIWNDDFTKGKLLALLYAPGTRASYMDGITDGSEAVLSHALRQVLPEMGAALMKPLDEKLEDLKATGVVLIPCGLLSIFPLHAASYDGERCLLTQYNVCYAPSAQTIFSSDCRRNDIDRRPPKFVGIGDPGGDLKHAKTELMNVAEGFHKNNATLLIHQSGSYKNLIRELPGATHLHFACHGIFFPNRPLDSALFLTKRERLTLHDILYDSQLQSLENLRLVVLSACQTALVDFQNLPDEVLGLPSGFLQKGVPGVVGTLWPIDDLSTSLLMTQFYKYMLGGKEPAVALRKAQLWLRDLTAAEVDELIQKISAHPASTRNFYYAGGVANSTGERPYSNPYHWAGFILIGL